MRILPLAIVLLLLPLASAQSEEPGCTQEDPCPIEITVDETGFSGDRNWTVTEGDWYQLIVTNLDSDFGHHTVSMEDFAIVMQVGAPDEEKSRVFQFDKSGTFPIRDEPTEDQVFVTVTDLDAVEAEQGFGDGQGPSQDSPTDDNGAPGVPALLVLLSLAGMVLLARRRQ